jgi:hypothetical protein
VLLGSLPGSGVRDHEARNAGAAASTAQTQERRFSPEEAMGAGSSPRSLGWQGSVAEILARLDWAGVELDIGGGRA